MRARAAALGSVLLIPVCLAACDSGSRSDGSDGGQENSHYDASATAACLTKRFELVDDRDVHNPGSWYGGAKMEGKVSVLAGYAKGRDFLEADLGKVTSVDIGFAESEDEALKVEDWVRVHGALPIDRMFKRIGNAAIVWGGEPPRDLREQVERCVTQSADSGAA